MSKTPPEDLREFMWTWLRGGSGRRTAVQLDAGHKKFAQQLAIHGACRRGTAQLLIVTNVDAETKKLLAAAPPAVDRLELIERTG